MGWGWRGLGGCWGGGGRVGWGGGVLQLEDIMSTSHPRWKRRRWEKKWEEPRKEDTTSRFPQMLFIREEEEEAPLLLLLLPFTPSPMLIIRCTCLKTELCWIQPPPPLFYDVHWLNTDFYKCFPFIITVSAWWLHCSRSWSNPPRTRRGAGGKDGGGVLLQFNYLEKHKVRQDGSFSHSTYFWPVGVNKYIFHTKSCVIIFFWQPM